MIVKSMSVVIAGVTVLAGLPLRSEARASAQNGAVDPRGPIAVPGMKVVTGEGAVQTSGYTFRSPGKKPNPWQASWIWLDDRQSGTQRSKDDRRGPVAFCFRREIGLAEAPRKVLAWMTADLHYRLYINGRLVARGPADAGQDFSGGRSGNWYYDTYDLTPFFRKGANVVAAEVFVQKLGGWHGSSGHRGLLFEADLTLPGGRKETLRTDTSWRSVAAPYFEMNDWPPSETPAQSNRLLFSADREPPGWKMPGFDDSGWHPCAPAGPYWPRLLPNEVPPLMEASYPLLRVARAGPGVHAPERPFQDGRGVVITADGSFALEYDRILSGHAGLRVKGGAGSVLNITLCETRGHDGRRKAVMRLRDGEQYFETPFYSSFSVLLIEARHVTSPIEIQDVKALFTSTPVRYRGSFVCSDQILNRIWQTARWAVQICMQTYHLDSPDHQEPLADPGDYLIESLVNYYTFGEPWLPRQDLRKFAAILQASDYRNFHTSYALLWLQMLLDYYDYTGDEALVKELAPQVHGLLARFTSYRGRAGILSEAPNYMFMDWVSIGGFNVHHPPAVIGQGYLTAFYCRALSDAQRVATITGDTPQAARYDALRQEVAAAFHRALWNPEKGLYRDGKPFETRVPPNKWLPPDTEIETFSPHVNTLAVLYDLAPKNLQQGILEKLMAEPSLNVQPYFMHFVLDALGHAGLFERYGPEQMRRWKIVPETQSFPEMWTSGDLSHGWCSTPLYQLSSRVLGVIPRTAGFRTVAVHPSLCDLQWARGIVPTPRGDVSVSWSRSASELELNVLVPPGMGAEIAIPADPAAQPVVVMNGKPLWRGRTSAGKQPVRRTESAIVVDVPAGRYQFVVRSLPTGGQK